MKTRHSSPPKSNTSGTLEGDEGLGLVSGTLKIAAGDDDVDRFAARSRAGSGPFGFGDTIIEEAGTDTHPRFRRARFLATIEGRGNSREDFHALAREVRDAARIRHFNILATIDISQDDVLRVTTEYEMGPSLLDLLEEGRIPVAISLRILQDVVQGLAHLHRSKTVLGHPRVHSDVRPRNIIVGYDGTTRLFGYRLRSLFAPNLGSEVSNEVASYASPEQLMDDGVDPRSDLFSIGVILWETIVGRPLFRAATPMDSLYNTVARPAARLQDEVRAPAELSRLCSKLLAKSRSERPANALVLARELVLVAQEIGEVASHADVANLVATRAGTL